MKGKCLCGQIEFEVFGVLPNLYQCHCSLCKKATGTSSCSALVVDLDKLKWVAGEDKIKSFTKENGFRTDFCSDCGSPVPNKMNVGDYMWIPAGVLEGKIGSRIGAHIFKGNMAEWEDEIADCISLDGGPGNLDEFMRSLHRE